MTRSDGVQVFPVTISNDLPVGFTFLLIEDVPTGVTVTAVIQTINVACSVNKTWLSLGCYCIPTYTTGCSSNDAITNVSLEGESIDLDNTSTCSDDDYSYYASLPQPDLAPGEEYTLSVSTGYSSPTSEQVIAWIDYNKDGEFETNEIIANTAGAGLVGGSSSFDFTVPEGTNPGSYRLRVRLVYGSSVPTWGPCNSQSFGETEDYKIEILELADCEGTPSAGIISSTHESYCGNSPIEFLATGVDDPANGLERIWQSSPTGDDNWTDIAGAVSPSFTYTAGISVPTDFRFKVTCTLSALSDVSNVISLGINPANECYCTPEGTNSSRYISSSATVLPKERIHRDTYLPSQLQEVQKILRITALPFLQEDMVTTPIYWLSNQQPNRWRLA